MSAPLHRHHRRFNDEMIWAAHQAFNSAGMMIPNRKAATFPDPKFGMFWMLLICMASVVSAPIGTRSMSRVSPSWCSFFKQLDVHQGCRFFTSLLREQCFSNTNAHPGGFLVQILDLLDVRPMQSTLPPKKPNPQPPPPPRPPPHPPEPFPGDQGK